VGGGLAKTLDNALKFRNKGQQVQVEVRSQAELDEAIAGGPESILLNYMTPAAVKKSVKQIRAQAPGVTIEAAGSITLANVKKYAAAGVDFVAVGALTTAPALVDLSLKITVHAS
jgi:nicotinate-nucleotide pyrophosphorylase (carboxylating)